MMFDNMDKAMKELREGQEATVNLLELVQRGYWPDENSKPLANFICRDLAQIFEQGISGPAARSCWQSMSAIRSNEEMGMPKLESLVEKGNWPGKDSQPYARLLCANINRTLDLLGTDHASSEGVTRENQQLGLERDAFSSDPARSKKASRKKAEEIIWTAFENGTDFDGFTWNKYGSKEIKDEKYKRDYYRCASMGCPAKKQMQQTDEAGRFKVAWKGLHTCKGPEPASGSGLSSGPMRTSDVTMPDCDNSSYVSTTLVRHRSYHGAGSLIL